MQMSKTSLSFLVLLSAATLGFSSLMSISFDWEPKSDEPGFTIDVPSKWQTVAKSREKVAYVQFEKSDFAGRVAIEVRSYLSDLTEVDQLLLQLRTRLAVKYDQLYLQSRKGLSYRKDVEKQVWIAYLGKKSFQLTTAFITGDGKILQLTCIAPRHRAKEYEIVFDNALLSLNFSDGKSGESSASAPSSLQSSSSSTPSAATKPKPPTNTPPSSAPPTTTPSATKPPKIEF